MDTNRRRFLQASTAAAVFSKTILGANDRINVAAIGLGARFNLLDAAYYKQEDATVAAICDINKAKLDAYQSKYKDKKFDVYADYRRILDRKDIDAVVLTVPDHQHAPVMIAALDAGKDVYCEKPATNTVEAGVAMLKAYRAHKQVVQLGTQQRSWPHFRAAAKLIWDGYIGDVTHVVVAHSAGGGGMGGGRGGAAAGPSATPPAIPEGLDWNGFLGPAKKVPYDPQRYSSWRNYWDYGCGMISDWGVHWMDIVMLCMQSNVEGASYVTSVSVLNDNREMASGDWLISYKYNKYLMTFTGFVPPTSEPLSDGPTFYGTKGWLRVNRNGYIVRGNRAAVRSAFTPAGQAAAAGRGAPPAQGAPGAGGPPQGGPPQGGPPPQGGAMAQGGRGGGGRGGQPQTPPIDDITEVDPAKNVPGERGSEIIHVRNFLDCVKSRQKPTAEFEIGFHSTLPCLLGRQSVKEQRSLVWDETNLVAKPA